MVLEEEQTLEYLHERERFIAQLEADIGDIHQYVCMYILFSRIKYMAIHWYSFTFFSS